MLQIPFTDYPSYTRELTLDDITCTYKFVWNTRGEFWAISIFDKDLNPIISGLKLVLNYELLTGLHHLPIPIGNLYVIDLTNDVSKIKYEDFNGKRQLMLVYEELSDLVTV